MHDAPNVDRQSRSSLRVSPLHLPRRLLARTVTFEGKVHCPAVSRSISETDRTRGKHLDVYGVSIDNVENCTRAREHVLKEANEKRIKHLKYDPITKFKVKLARFTNSKKDTRFLFPAESCFSFATISITCARKYVTMETER